VSRVAVACYDEPMQFESDAIPAESIRPLLRVEYEQLGALGFFDEERVELLRGRMVRMSNRGPDHDGALERLNEILVIALVGRARVRIQSALAALEDSMPQPDVAVVDPGDHDDAHPTSAALVIEVSKTSLSLDRKVKTSIYAECGVSEYWIVNLVDGVIEVARNPENGVYREAFSVSRDDTLTLVRFPDVAIPVSRILR
jgi:Uma2 family endonuclease